MQEFPPLMKLSVLDQSLARSPEGAPEALSETLEMAAFCEQLGYERFWVAEHHNLPGIASTSPEILIGQIGAATKSQSQASWNS